MKVWKEGERFARPQMLHFSRKEFNIEDYREFYTIMCEDIMRERKRIGGDWAVAGLALTQSLRDHIR